MVSAQETNESQQNPKRRNFANNRDVFAEYLAVNNDILQRSRAWATSISLNRVGSVEGSYHDSDMGFIGEGYPHGTVYICKFSGVFDNIHQIDDTTCYDAKRITTESTESKNGLQMAYAILPQSLTD